MNDQRVGKPISVKGIAIVPVEKTCVRRYGLWSVSWAHGLKEPVAIVVRDADGMKVFDVEGLPMSLAAFSVAAPECEDLLHRFPAD